MTEQPERPPVPEVEPGWRVRRILPAEKSGHWSATSITERSDSVSELTIRQPDDCNHGEGENVCPECIESWSYDYDFYVISSDPSDPVARQPYTENQGTEVTVHFDDTDPDRVTLEMMETISAEPLNDWLPLYETARAYALDHDGNWLPDHLHQLADAYNQLPTDDHRRVIRWSIKVGIDNALSADTPRGNLAARMLYDLLDHLN